MALITHSDAAVDDAGSLALDADGSPSAPPVDADGVLPADTGGGEGSRSDAAVSANCPYEGTIAGNPVGDGDSRSLDPGGGECSASAAPAADGRRESSVAGDPVGDGDSRWLDPGGGECSASVADGIAEGCLCEYLYSGFSADGPYEGTITGDPVGDGDSRWLDPGGGECSASVADGIAEGCLCEYLFWLFRRWPI